MASSRRFSIGFVLLVFIAPILWAQTPPTRGNQDQAAKTTVIIDRQLVRFTVQGEAQEWRLEITNQQGEVAFDSGFVSGTTLEWPLHNQQGEAVGSGLYAYTLTIKDPVGEPTRTQRGHVILDRASSNDRVWVTS